MLKVICKNCGAEMTVEEKSGAGYCDNSVLKTIELVPQTVKSENKSANTCKETKNMVNAKYNSRMAKLAEAGFDVTALTAMFGDKNTELLLDQCMKEDPVFQEISNGYVKNTKLHRRYITAQFYRLYGEDGSWTKNYNSRYGYSYQFSMIAEEMRVLGILEKEDREAFEERASFFYKDTCLALLDDYAKKLEDELTDGRCYARLKNRKYGEYIHVGHGYGNRGCVKVANIYAEIINPIHACAERVNAAISYEEIAILMHDFFKSRKFIAIDWRTQKCSIFTDAFKGAGAYYSLKNMFMFNGLKGISKVDGHEISGLEAVKDLDERRKEYEGYGWRMLGYFREINKVNKFSWKKFEKNGYKNN